MKKAKHRKAEDLITRGQPIRIIGESDFLRLVDIDIEPTSAPKKSTSRKGLGVSIYIDPSHYCAHFPFAIVSI